MEGPNEKLLFCLFYDDTNWFVEKMQKHEFCFSKYIIVLYCFILFFSGYFLENFKW